MIIEVAMAVAMTSAPAPDHCALTPNEARVILKTCKSRAAALVSANLVIFGEDRAKEVQKALVDACLDAQIEIIKKQRGEACIQNG